MMKTRWMTTFAAALLASTAFAGDEPAEATPETEPRSPVARYAATTGEGTVLLHAEATSSGTDVRLGDIARLSGPGAEALSDLVVATLGGGDGTVEISIESLRAALANAGVNWGRLDLRGYAVCRVSYVSPASQAAQSQAAESNPGREVDVSAMVTVRRYIVAAIREIAPFPDDEVVVEFREEDAALVDQRFDRDRMVVDVRSRIVPARVLVTVLWREDGRLVDRRNISVTVKRRVLAAVASSMIRSGDRFTRDNTEIRQIDLGSANVAPVTDLDQLLGKASTTLLKTGGIISARHIETPVAIRRGQTVTVHYRRGRLQIRIMGEAREDGAVGDWIEIQRLGKRETFTARVDGPGVAMVGDNTDGNRNTRTNDERGD